MSLNIFEYSTLSSDFSDWLKQNCSNCGDNFDDIPKCFYDETWSTGGESEIKNSWNGLRDRDRHEIPPYGGYNWPPTYSIKVKKDSSILIQRVELNTILAQFQEYMNNFKDKNKYATENGLITYMNMIGNFLIEHFSYVSSIFSPTTLMIYTSDKQMNLDEVPQNALNDNIVVPEVYDIRNTVHHEPIVYFMDHIFGNVRNRMRKHNVNYTVDYVTATEIGSTSLY